MAPFKQLYSNYDVELFLGHILLTKLKNGQWSFGALSIYKHTINGIATSP